MWPAETEVMVSQLCLMCGSTSNCQTICLGARPRYMLVFDVDVKKPTNQPNKQTKLVLVSVRISILVRMMKLIVFQQQKWIQEVKSLNSENESA